MSYTIKEVIGKGSYGEVYKVTHNEQVYFLNTGQMTSES
jgi:serine/threonine protein kinase